ncbi:hypothetical protein [Streptomyces lateritius]|uniref:hypothetical protein n=1 Tax=Streptomyces lateritius TaxID=67313 RepID=UPI0019CCB43C|nr:hypothetical protein [Streptomyces lateritius]GGT97677.1 hypothetical protein GCM10010272_48090 [Streptomyces lateritius]
MSDQDDAPTPDEPKGDGPSHGGESSGAAGGEKPGPDKTGPDKGEATAQAQPEPNPFDRAGRSPVDGVGGTGGAGTARAALRTLAPRPSGPSYEIGGDGQIYQGNQFVTQFWAGARPELVQGPVPRETLQHLDDVYCEVPGYRQMKDLLRSHRLLVLCGEPGSGRKATALALLSELTGHQVNRLDPRHRVDEIGTEALEPGGGHLLELPAEDGRAESEPRRDRDEPRDRPRPSAVRLSELHLDRFSQQLREQEAYGVVLVESGDLADRMLRGRYGMYCPPPPSGEVLHRHLRLLLRGEPEGALESARAVAERPEVVKALGLDALRPREAARLADHLAQRQKDELTEAQLLDRCGAFVRAQARTWFAGADRPGALPEALPALSATAFRIAVAVFNGSAYSITAEAAELLTWELSSTLDPERPPGRRLFGTHAESRPVLARSVLEDGELDLGPAKVPVRAVRFQGDALATAVLSEIWHGYHNVRGPVARWLRSLCDDPRPAVWVRASIAAGVLCSWDWIYGFGELIAPMASIDRAVPRMAAATALAEAARDPRVKPAVGAVLKEWASDGNDELRETVLLTHGYVLAAGTVSGSLDALARVVRTREAGDVDMIGASAFSVARLLASGDPEAVIRKLTDWLEDGRLNLANLVLVSMLNTLTIRTTHLWGLRDVPELEPHAARPLLVALLATRPGLAPALGALLRHTLSTARSGEAALDGLGSLLRRAAKDEEALGHVCRFLPLIAVSRRDRDRLRGLLKELVGDRDRPMDKRAAGRMWDAVAEGAER